MRPRSPGHDLCRVASAALCLLMGGCGQTGSLYLVMHPTTFPPITQHPVPVPSAATLVAAACVAVPTPASSVAPVAAPFPGTVVDGVPYLPGAEAPSPAPASLTAILPACVIYPPQRHRHRAPAGSTNAVPAAATRLQP